MTEVKNARQVPGEGFRRWFSDADHDLIVWYPDSARAGVGDVLGFQFCYGKLDAERALTWRRNGAAVHYGVDGGEDPYGMKMSPLLVSDGVYDAVAVAARFAASCAGVDPDLAAFVAERLRDARP